MHKRFFPQQNNFTYRVYYVVLPLPAQPIRGVFSRFYAKDLGKRDGSDPSVFAREVLATYGLADITKHIMLVTMPKVGGYVFNPVSFYFCFDVVRQLRAVIAEVHNTFGEQHAYLCVHPEHHPLTKDIQLEAQKLFHVSPFLARDGYYQFRFYFNATKLSIWIDYENAAHEKQLTTSLIGDLSPLSTSSLNQAFWRFPFVTIKAIMCIHWQAIKLAKKRARYLAKPKQNDMRVSVTKNIKKTNLPSSFIF